ncbi:MAG: 3'-5' exonuclease [Planctomycetaceae bacterium]|nr:putative bifunctional exonuclease/endonuclease protein [Planctomycetota bacterium]NUO15027.1 3'-5' exonuclease [Planctomycetaceae bacterium]
MALPTFVAIDFETAGNYPGAVCAVGLVRVERGRIKRRIRQLIRPPRSHVAYTEIHGITWQDVADKPDFGQAWPLLAPVLEGAAFLAAHNAGFDRAVLLKACRHFGLRPPDIEFRCTVRLARRVLGIRPARLDHVCGVLGIDLNHHEALSDAEACARIMLAALKAERESASMPGVPAADE